MTCEELLDEFRALGGIADNIGIGNGQHGRGIFPVDQAQPVRIHIPRSLMIPVTDTQLRNGELVVRSGAARKRETRFFDDYQREFGWSAGGRDSSFALQRAWHELPEEVITLLKTTCALDDITKRFEEPTEDNALQDYIRSRVFYFEDRVRFVPVIDLVNHHASATGYVVKDFVGVEGSFTDEVVVNYNKLFDSLSIALSWGFADQANCANSLGLRLGFQDGLEFMIERAINQNKEVGDIVYPATQISKNRVTLAFLSLGNKAAPATPQAVFRELLGQRLTDDEADPVFNTIAEVNKEHLRNLRDLARKYDTPLTGVLADAAAHQLKAIAASVDD